MRYFENVIVGSGPAGVAAAFMLDAPGTCLLDVGHRADYQFPYPTLSDALSSGAVSDILGKKWETLVNISHPLTLHPKLRAEGVRHAFQGEAFDVVDQHGRLIVQGRGSFALGGMANVWGAQLLRYTDRDIKEVGSWPIGAAELDPYYSALEAHIGISGAIDAMAPFLGGTEHLLPPVPMGESARYLLQAYIRNKTRIPLVIGRPRLAVLTQAFQGRMPCEYSGTEFFSPAPTGVYSPLVTLDVLKSHGNITQMTEHKLLSYTECADHVDLEVEVLRTSEKIQIRTKHLLLGCGTIQTAKMVLLANQRAGWSLPFLDHPPTLLPIFIPRCFGRSEPSRLYPVQLIGTLNGLINRDMISFYSLIGMLWSDLIPDIPLPLNAARSILGSMWSSLMVAQIWQPSKNGECNRLTVDQQGKISIRYSDIKPYSNMRELLSSLRLLGGYSLASLSSSPPPSWGFHHAGTLPMKAIPNLFETHVDGRLWNSRRIRIIDGSVLPSLPAKNHSLTIMANSARIADITKSCGY